MAHKQRTVASDPYGRHRLDRSLVGSSRAWSGPSPGRGDLKLELFTDSSPDAQKTYSQRCFRAALLLGDLPHFESFHVKTVQDHAVFEFHRP
jgi:hypothetical protein